MNQDNIDQFVQEGGLKILLVHLRHMKSTSHFTIINNAISELMNSKYVERILIAEGFVNILLDHTKPENNEVAKIAVLDALVSLPHTKIFLDALLASNCKELAINIISDNHSDPVECNYAFRLLLNMRDANITYSPEFVATALLKLDSENLGLVESCIAFITSFIRRVKLGEADVQKMANQQMKLSLESSIKLMPGMLHSFECFEIYANMGIIEKLVRTMGTDSPMKEIGGNVLCAIMARHTDYRERAINAKALFYAATWFFDEIKQKANLPRSSNILCTLLTDSDCCKEFINMGGVDSIISALGPSVLRGTVVVTGVAPEVKKKLFASLFNIAKNHLNLLPQMVCPTVYTFFDECLQGDYFTYLIFGFVDLCFEHGVNIELSSLAGELAPRATHDLDNNEYLPNKNLLRMMVIFLEFGRTYRPTITHFATVIASIFKRSSDDVEKMYAAQVLALLYDGVRDISPDEVEAITWLSPMISKLSEACQMDYIEFLADHLCPTIDLAVFDLLEHEIQLENTDCIGGLMSLALAGVIDEKRAIELVKLMLTHWDPEDFTTFIMLLACLPEIGPKFTQIIQLINEEKDILDPEHISFRFIEYLSMCITNNTNIII